MHTDFQKMLEISFLIHKNPDDMEMTWTLDFFWDGVLLAFLYIDMQKTKKIL